jgi:putative DNA primase/helicase
MSRPNGKSFRFLSFNQLMQLPDPTWLLGGVLPANSVAMLFGPSGSGKTFVGLGMLLSIATGKPWMEGSSVKRGTVMYCFGEGGSGVKKRVAAWCKYHRKRGSNANIEFHDGAVNLYDRADVLAFIDEVKQRPFPQRYPLCVAAFDTVARCSVGAEENSNSEMGQVLEHCDLIRDELGITVLLVHHTGKTESNEPRGASALRAAMDAMLLADRKSKQAKYEVVLKTSKMKDDEELPPVSVRLVPVDLPRGQTSLVAVPTSVVQDQGDEAANDNLSTNQKAVYDIIAAAGAQGITWSDVRAAARDQGVGNGRSSALAELKAALIKKGLVVQQGECMYTTEHASSHGQAAAG